MRRIATLLAGTERWAQTVVGLDREWNAAQCEAFVPSGDDARLPSSPAGCPTNASPDNRPASTFIVGGADAEQGIPAGYTLTVPSTPAQAMDEFVAGVEVEAFEDLRLGVAYQDRRLIRALEDLSLDNGEIYYIGNPGRFDADAEARMVRAIEGMTDGPYLKKLVRDDAGHTVTAASVNPSPLEHNLNWRRTTERAEPLSVRLGAKVWF